MLMGGAGFDIASYRTSDAGVEVSLQDGTGMGGHAEGDTLTGIEALEGSEHNDKLTGDDGANWLFGNAGNDELDGGEGDDWLDGGAGYNILEGGAGADVLRGMDDASFTDYDTLHLTPHQMPLWKYVWMRASPGAAMPKAIRWLELKVLSRVLIMMTYW